VSLDFLNEAPKGAALVLEAFAAAESLTDDVARSLYQIVPIDGVSADLFIRALHYADFIEPRNSEWSFVPEIRRSLQDQNRLSPETLKIVHRKLFELGKDGDRKLAGDIIPSYLFTDAGQAYHAAGQGNVPEALAHYADAAKAKRLTGAQWLASQLAQEQEERRILPSGSIEINFLRARVLFRQGRRKEAELLFRRVAETDEPRSEVAIAMSILGNMIGKHDPRTAEAFFRRSIEIDDGLANPDGVAQTLHSLGNLLARNRVGEAERAYQRSIGIGEETKDAHGVAQRLHSLGNLLAKDRKRAAEAEDAYMRGIEILERIGDAYGIAQILHSLGNLFAKTPDRAKEAEHAYRHSIEIGEEIGRRLHIAQALHSLGILLARMPGRAKEAEQAYRRSVEIDQSENNIGGVGQTLHSLGRLLADDPERIKEAEEAFRRSIKLGEASKDRYGLSLRLRSFSKFLSTLPGRSEEAEKYRQQSLDLDKGSDNRQGESRGRKMFKPLRDRLK
jgi:tetratricopeptide (TPR) repeat protein